MQTQNIPNIDVNSIPEEPKDNTNNFQAFVTRNVNSGLLQFSAYATHEEIIRTQTISNIEKPFLFFDDIPDNIKKFHEKNVFILVHDIGDIELERLKRIASPIGKSTLPNIVNMWEYPKIMELIIQEKHFEAMMLFKNEYIKKVHLSDAFLDKLKYASWVLAVPSAALTAYQVAKNENRLEELEHQALLLGSGFWAGLETGNLALVPCGFLGVATPACVAGASIVGGIFGTEIGEMFWQFLKKNPSKLSTNNLNQERSLQLPSLINSAAASQLSSEMIHLKESNTQNFESSDLEYLLLYIGQDPKDVYIKQLWYRGDSRMTHEVFKKGFAARGTNFDILSHVDKDLSHDSAYIATSTSKEVASKFPRESFQAFVYEINPQKHARDVTPFIFDAVNKGLLHEEDGSIFLKEKEMAVLKKIKASDIKGAWRVDVKLDEEWGCTEDPIFIRRITNEYIANPNYANKIAEKILQTAKVTGHGLAGVGVAIDGMSLYESYETSKSTGNYNPFFRESARIVGGWSGAFALGKKSALLGVKIGRIGGPVGSAIGAVVGGLTGSILGYIAVGKIATEGYDLIRIKDANARESTPLKITLEFAKINNDGTSRVYDLFTLPQPISQFYEASVTPDPKKIEILHEKSRHTILNLISHSHSNQLKYMANQIAHELRGLLDTDATPADKQRHWLNHKDVVLDKHFLELGIDKESAEGSFFTNMISDAYFVTANSLKKIRITKNDYTKTKKSIEGLKDDLKNKMDEYEQEEGDLYQQEMNLIKKSETVLQNPILSYSEKQFLHQSAEVSNTIALMAHLSGKNKFSNTMFKSSAFLTTVPSAIDASEKIAGVISGIISSGSFNIGTLIHGVTATNPILLAISLGRQLFGGGGDVQDKRHQQVMNFLALLARHLDHKLDFMTQKIQTDIELTLGLHEKADAVLVNQEKFAELTLESFFQIKNRLEQTNSLLGQISNQISHENAETQAMILEWWSSDIEFYNEIIQRKLERGGKSLENFLENHFDIEYSKAKKVITSKAFTSAEKDFSPENTQSLLKHLRIPRSFFKSGNDFLDVFNAINLLQEYAINVRDDSGILLPNWKYSQLSHPVGVYILAKSFYDLVVRLQQEGKNVRLFLPSIDKDIKWLSDTTRKSLEFFREMGKKQVVAKIDSRISSALDLIGKAIQNIIVDFELEKIKQNIDRVDGLIRQEERALADEQNWAGAQYTVALPWVRPPWELGWGFSIYREKCNSNWNSNYPNVGLNAKWNDAFTGHITLPCSLVTDGLCRIFVINVQSVLWLDSSIDINDQFKKSCIEYNKEYARRTDLHWQMKKTNPTCETSHLTYMNDQCYVWTDPRNQKVHYFVTPASSFSDAVLKKHNSTLAKDLSHLSQQDLQKEQKDYFRDKHKEIIEWIKDKRIEDKTHRSLLELDGQELLYSSLPLLKCMRQKNGNGILPIPHWLPWNKLFAEWYKAELLGRGYISFIYSFPDNKILIEITYHNFEKDKDFNLANIELAIDKHVVKFTNAGNHQDSAYKNEDLIKYFMLGGYYYNPNFAKKIFYAGHYGSEKNKKPEFFQIFDYPSHIKHPGKWNETSLPEYVKFEKSSNFDELVRNETLANEKQQAHFRAEVNLRINNAILQRQLLGQSIDQFELPLRMQHHNYLSRSPNANIAKNLHTKILKIAAACDREGLLEFISSYHTRLNNVYLLSHIQACQNQIHAILKDPLAISENLFGNEILLKTDEMITDIFDRLAAPATFVIHSDEDIIDLDESDNIESPKIFSPAKADPIENAVANSASKQKPWLLDVLSFISVAPSFLRLFETYRQTNNQVTLVNPGSNITESSVVLFKPQATSENIVLYPKQTITLDPITGKYIFDYSYSWQGKEIAGITLFADKDPCKATDGVRDNIIGKRGFFLDARIQIKTDYECSVLPPAFEDFAYEGAAQGASMGVMRGAANVIGGKHSWRATGLFYVGYFGYRFFDAYHQESNQDGWSAIYKAAGETLWLAGSEVVLAQASHGLKIAGNYLQDVKNTGVQLVGKAANKLSGAVGYAIYACEGFAAWNSPTPFRTVTQLATRVVSNITSGYVAQQATEKVGALIGSAFRLFKCSRQAAMVPNDTHNELRLL